MAEGNPDTGTARSSSPPVVQPLASLQKRRVGLVTPCFFPSASHRGESTNGAGDGGGRREGWIRASWAAESPSCPAWKVPTLPARCPPSKFLQPAHAQVEGTVLFVPTVGGRRVRTGRGAAGGGGRAGSG